MKDRIRRQVVEMQEGEPSYPDTWVSRWLEGLSIFPQDNYISVLFLADAMLETPDLLGKLRMPLPETQIDHVLNVAHKSHGAYGVGYSLSKNRLQELWKSFRGGAEDLISKHMVDLFCPDSDHQLSQAFDFIREHPDILAKMQRAIRGSVDAVRQQKDLARDHRETLRGGRAPDRKQVYAMWDVALSGMRDAFPGLASRIDQYFMSLGPKT